MFERTVSENGAEEGGMAKGARHRVDEPGSRWWRPDIDKHPRSLIEGWAAATDAVRGRATAELPCTTRPRGDHGREVHSKRRTRTAGACTTMACKSGQGQCQSGKEFSIESYRNSDTDRQRFEWSVGSSRRRERRRFLYFAIPRTTGTMKVETRAARATGPPQRAPHAAKRMVGVPLIHNYSP